MWFSVSIKVGEIILINFLTKRFFNPQLLEQSDLFHFVPVVVISTIVSWFIVWFVSHKQLEKGIGRFNKILVPSLFVIMFFIVIYSLTLDGASIGLKILFKPDWSLLKSFSIWTSAYGQVLFSLSLGYSEAYTYAGYTGRDTDLVTSAIITTIANCGFENFCALGVFSVLGHMSKVKSTAITKLVSQGTGLVFIAYPAVLNILGKLAYVIGPAFFLSVLFAGLTSMLSMIEPFSFSIQNKFTWSRKKTATIEIIFGAICSMLFATGYGNELLGHVDNYINNVLVLFSIAIECYIFSWAFDIKRAMRTLNDRSKSIKLGWWWLAIIRVILPIIIIVIWFGTLYEMFSNGSVAQTVIFGISTIVIFGVTAVFTFLKPTNKSYDEVENRL
jgi:NSS family neurotransmitter:Na+ symporter